MSTHKKYTYAGNRSGADQSVAIVYDGKTYGVGSEIEMTEDEAQRVSAYYVLLDSDGKDIAEGTTSPVDKPIDFSEEPKVEPDAVPAPEPDAESDDASPKEEPKSGPVSNVKNK